MPRRSPCWKAPVFLLLLLVGCGQSHAQLLLSASVSAEVRLPAPTRPPPPPAVSLSGATVVEFFGVPLDGAQDVIFVLDVSGSMNQAATGRIAGLEGYKKGDTDGTTRSAASPTTQVSASPSRAQPSPRGAQPSVAVHVSTKMEIARAELMSAIERLSAETRMNIIFFGNDLLAYASQVTPLHEPERAGWLEFVGSAHAGGSTALAPAMRTAFLLNARRVILLSDGYGNEGGDDYDVLRDAREAMQGGVRIDTIGIGDHDRELMRALAVESGGLYQAL